MNRKGFTEINPLEVLSSDTPTPAEPKTATEPKTKRKVGRPKIKTEETKTINIAIPVSVLDKLHMVKICYGNNVTQYINKLIERDLEANYDKYKQIADSLNNFK